MTRYPFVFAAVFAIAAAILIADHKTWLIDDRNHHDGLLVQEQLADARRENRSSLNVIPIAGGNWLALCLVGPGENPRIILRRFSTKHGIRTSTFQRLRSWLYVGSVPKGEVALVFVTGSHSIRSRRLPNDTGNPAFKSSCALRSDPGLRFR